MFLNRKLCNAFTQNAEAVLVVSRGRTWPRYSLPPNEVYYAERHVCAIAHAEGSLLMPVLRTLTEKIRPTTLLRWDGRSSFHDICQVTE